MKIVARAQRTVSHRCWRHIRRPLGISSANMISLGYRPKHSSSSRPSLATQRSPVDSRLVPEQHMVLCPRDFFSSMNLLTSDNSRVLFPVANIRNPCQRKHYETMRNDITLPRRLQECDANRGSRFRIRRRPVKH